MTWLHRASANSAVQSAGTICSPAMSGGGEQHDRAEQAGEEQQGQRRQLGAGAFDEDQIARVEQPGERREQVAAQMRRRQFGASDHQQARSRSRRGRARAPESTTAICAPATAPRRRTGSWRYCRTGWRCRAWSAGSRHATRQDRRRRRRRRAGSRRPAPRAASAPAGGRDNASRNRNGTASASRQKPAATGPTPAWRTRNGPVASATLPTSSATNAQRCAVEPFRFETISVILRHGRADSICRAAVGVSRKRTMPSLFDPLDTQPRALASQPHPDGAADPRPRDRATRCRRRSWAIIMPSAPAPG